jgi:3-hydroxy-9,10-secoandrosta-1,3,5(10)-triene-9,17-dione monooxygenase
VNTAIDAGFNMEAGMMLLQKAKELRPLLAKHAAQHEDAGELSTEVVETLAAAGFWKMAVPRRWGGLCISSNMMAQIAGELAKGCPSTAWVIGVMNSGVWLTSLLPDAAQRAVFANGIPRVSSVGGPPGIAKSTEGGYTINGRWGYGSGSHHAEWIYCAISEPDGGQGPGGGFAAPASDFKIERTWRVAGMKGTGSDTIVAKDLFVPAERVYLMKNGMVGNRMPGQKLSGSITDRWPVFALLRSKALGVLVGIAEGLLEQLLSDKGKRPILYTTYAQKIDSAVFRAGMGKAAAQIRAARHLMDHSTNTLDAAALQNREPTYEERGRSRGDAAMAVDLLMNAVDSLMNLAGSGSFALESNIQRYWRDFSVGSRHAVLLPEMGFEASGGILLGLEPDKNIAPPDFI